MGQAVKDRPAFHITKEGPRDNRLILVAVLWIARTAAPWPDLPDRFGKFDTVFQRFNRWAKSGVLARVMEALGAGRRHRTVLISW
jgi:transposase